MNVYANMTKKAELLALQELYNDICFGDGAIEPDESGYFTSDKDNERTKILSELQDKYTYGWYIAEQSKDEQLNAITKFMSYIEDNYYET